MRLAGIGAPFLGLCAIVSCTEILGVGDYGTATCGAFASSSAGCEACTKESCCSEVAQCNGDERCAPAFSCLAGCADEECRASCSGAKSDAIAALAACQARSCGAECGLQCGGVYAFYLGRLAKRSPECLDCLTGPLCDVGTTCAKSAQCLGLMGCRENCSPLDTLCRMSCTPAYRQGDAMEFDTRLALRTCTAECGLGQNWSCVGKVSWPGATDTRITFRFQVISSATSLPLKGVRATACGGGSVDCKALSQQAWSAANGGVALDIPLWSGPFDGYFELTGAEPGLVPTLWTQYPYPGATNDVPDYFPFYATVMATSTLDAMASDLGVTMDPSRGTVLVLPYDCDASPAGGVALALDPPDAAIRQFYLDSGGHARATATSTDVATAAGPTGGFLDVPPGLVTLTASVVGIGKVSEVSALVRAGAVTLLEIVPTP